MTVNPAISVLMPVYNASPYLEKAINSILNQDFPDFELVIIDDGSKDNSLEILKKFASKDARIKLSARQNKGISATRNELIDMASAELIAWMDADDISLSHRLSAQYNYLKSNKKYVAIGARTQLIDKDDDGICEWPLPLTHQEIDSWHINGLGGAIIFPSSMMRKKKVLDINAFDVSLTGAEDLDIFLKLAEVGSLANINTVCLCYRQHIDSICHEKKDQIRKDTQRVVDAASQRRGLNPVILESTKANSKKPEIYSKWVWWSLKGGNKQTARKYALKSIMLAPTNLSYWKALFCAFRGY